MLDRVTGGPKPALVAALGVTHHHSSANEVAARLQPDVVIEATGVGQVVFDVLAHTASSAIVCLTGLSAPGRTLTADAGGIDRELVLENVVVGSVSANLRHYRTAAQALADADRTWLNSVISRRVPLFARTRRHPRGPRVVHPTARPAQRCGFAQ